MTYIYAIAFSILFLESLVLVTGWKEIITLIVLVVTAIETARMRESNNRAIDLTKLPVIMLIFKEDKTNKGNYIPYLKNLRDIPAYAITVEPWIMHLLDVHWKWSVEIKQRDNNLIEGKSEKQLKLVCKSNDKILADDANFVVMESYFRHGLAIAIRYKNFVGEKFYTVVKATIDPDTGEKIIEMIRSPRKYDLYFYIYKFNDFINTKWITWHMRLITRLDTPGFKSPDTKYDLISLLRRFVSNKWKSKSAK